MFKIAVVGPSSFSDTKFLTEELDKIKPKASSFVTGDANGVEALTEAYAKRNNMPVEVLYHQPNVKGSRLYLNNNIVKNCDALVVFWDSENKSVLYAINTAIRLRKHIKIVYVGYAEKDILLKKDVGFDGTQRWLSNMFPCEINIKGLRFMSVEAAYQASKYSHHPNIVKRFQNLPAIISKKYNQKLLAGDIDIVSDFDQRKIKIMKFLVNEKFKNPYLRQKLILTGDRELVEENNWHDTFWGVCNGEGENNLGKILMEIRGNVKKNT